MNALVNLSIKGMQMFSQKISGAFITNTFVRKLPSGISYGIFFNIPNLAVKKNYSSCVADLLKLGFNQVQIAKMLNVSQSTVSRLARGL
ncbi:helix-turn-helix domain-containing protein [Butyrivibrio sp. WCD3002]|uniref:helix-turn-helix domain-containing protein n=1 Tax=Butyrivibrio sp. WCD3002 TaxID=1280676 RepID=UPI0004798E05|nr:helix-turn-helix domain-containing protein [Butyrivibrio sp. WCD3002]